MTFRTKPAIRYFARPALLVLIFSNWCFSLLYGYKFICYAIRSIYDGSNISQGILFLVIIIVLNIFSLFITIVYFKELHEKCFAKIKICESEIIWKCIFRKRRSILISDCKFIGVESERSFNGLDYPFIYFSAFHYPSDFIHKIDKLKISNEFIKFWYMSELSEYIISHLPKEKTGGLQYYCNQKRVKRRNSNS